LRNMTIFRSRRDGQDGEFQDRRQPHQKYSSPSKTATTFAGAAIGSLELAAVIRLVKSH
jgi:hypothetical protein